MRVVLNPKSIDDYDLFLRVKSLPRYRFEGRTAVFPDEYARRLGIESEIEATGTQYVPSPFLFDYQADIAAMAIQKERFAVFADCGLGKTLILLEFARHALAVSSGIVMIVSPLMVIDQTLAEAHRWYGDALPIERIHCHDIQSRLNSDKPGIIITNYEALSDELECDHLTGLIPDESSMLKSHYGKWGQALIRLGRGVRWKLASTGTPAPNDRIEYANHAVFLDQHPTLNAFLARYFVNRGQTDNRWELKPHALEPFYRDLSHWSIFLSRPSVYGWKSNADPLPPIHVHIHDVPLTDEQTQLAYNHTGTLFADRIGGITSRSVLSQIAKGSHRGNDIQTRKPAFIRSLVDSWPDESTIIWCWYNREQEILASTFPEAHSITGATTYEDRMAMLADFKSGRTRVLISKPRILGFGLNLEIATRQVFSGLVDSYEAYYQAVKRSNRYGSTRPLHVHIPVTDLERPMIETVLHKAHRVQEDTETQERIFRRVSTQSF